MRSLLLLAPFVFALLVANACAIVPVTPNASPEARAVLNYLHETNGKKTLFGQIWDYIRLRHLVRVRSEPRSFGPPRRIYDTLRSAGPLAG